jgi:hypothetical protein
VLELIFHLTIHNCIRPVVRKFGEELLLQLGNFSFGLDFLIGYGLDFLPSTLALERVTLP